MRMPFAARSTDYTDSVWTVVLFIYLSYGVVIVMLNALIALMNDTFNRMQSQVRASS